MARLSLPFLSKRITLPQGCGPKRAACSRPSLPAFLTFVARTLRYEQRGAHRRGPALSGAFFTLPRIRRSFQRASGGSPPGSFIRFRRPARRKRGSGLPAASMRLFMAASEASNEKPKTSCAWRSQAHEKGPGADSSRPEKRNYSYFSMDTPASLKISMAKASG